MSVELSGFTILLLVIPKFFDSIAKFLKGCTQQTAANYPGMPLMLTQQPPCCAVKIQAVTDSKPRAGLCHQSGFDRLQEISKLFHPNNPPKTTLGKILIEFGSKMENITREVARAFC